LFLLSFFFNFLFIKHIWTFIYLIVNIIFKFWGKPTLQFLLVQMKMILNFNIFKYDWRFQTFLLIESALENILVHLSFIFIVNSSILHSLMTIFKVIDEFIFHLKLSPTWDYLMNNRFNWSLTIWIRLSIKNTEEEIESNEY